MQNEISMYIEELKFKEKAELTITSYANDLAQFQKWAGSQGITDVAKITRRDIKNFISSLQVKNKDGSFSKMVPKSKNRKLSAIREWLKFLVNEDVLEHSPAASIENIDVEKPMPVFLNEDQMNTVFECVRRVGSKRDIAIFEILYGMGLRVSELSTLKVNKLHFNQRRSYVKGKGDKTRMVPLNPRSVDALYDYINDREFDSEYVFYSPTDSTKRLSTRTIYDVVIKYCERCGFKGISPHKLRHTCATHLLSNGMPISHIKELLGHADISTTDGYAHVIQQDMVDSFNNAHRR